MRRILTFGGLGGLICGIDFGIIAVAVPYIRSLRLYSDSQIGWIVGGVLFGGILASACGGFLCDRLGRRAAVRLAAGCFLVSIPVICLSGVSFPLIMGGRILQGLSCGFLSVAMPMYLAETLPPDRRGKGTAIFQLFLGIGLVLAALAGVVLAKTLGMAIALFSNQFVAWGLASAFLPLANAWGFGPLFLSFAAFGGVYFATTIFIPETKGKTLEEIETLFDKKAPGVHPANPL